VRELPVDYATSRDALHRVATHVLARRRVAVNGRFGLRPTPGGFGAPAFGDPDREEVLRTDGAMLVRERRVGDEMRTTVHAIAGASLTELAAFADVDLATPLSVGRDTPPLGDPTAPLTVDVTAAAVLAEWLHWGAQALDGVLAQVGADAEPVVAQLWPEHFDLGLDLSVGGTRVNLGASAGDHHHDAPYVYVGPWTDDRPGDARFWNAPFGGLLGHRDVAEHADPVAAMTGYFRRGLDLLAG
jgi:hypothetical protein